MDSRVRCKVVSLYIQQQRIPSFRLTWLEFSEFVQLQTLSLFGTGCTFDSSLKADADYLGRRPGTNERIVDARELYKVCSCKRFAKTVDLGTKLEYLVDRLQEAQLQGSCLPNHARVLPSRSYHASHAALETKCCLEKDSEEVGSLRLGWRWRRPSGCLTYCAHVISL